MPGYVDSGLEEVPPTSLSPRCYVLTRTSLATVVALFVSLSSSVVTAENASEADEASPGPVQVGCDIAPPTQTTPCFRDMEYTEEARTERKEGGVILQATISREGVVKDVKVLRGLGYGLDEVATEALRKCKFKPAYSRQSGEPVEVTYNVVADFQLTE